MRKILVAGGAGFIGSHLCRKLLEQGNMVTCFDNLQSGNMDNIFELAGNKNFHFINKDIAIPFCRTGPFGRVSQIYNLACPNNPADYQANPVKSILTSTLGSIDLLNVARETFATVLQASTSGVYGDPEICPQNENYRGRVDCIGAQSCYEEGNRAAETLFFNYHRQYQADIRVIRIFDTYGPHMAHNGVVSNFIIQALNNQDITIYGDGSQTRSFQYVDDLVDGMIKMMNNESDFIGPVNIGNPEKITIKELAENILRLIPESKSRIIYKNAVSDGPRHTVPIIPDISLAKEELDWSPKIDLETGLKKTIEYFKKYQIKK